MRGKITVDALKAIPKPEQGKSVRLSDTELSGFHAFKHSTGRVTFHVEYGPRERRRRMKVGTLGELTAAEARERARAELAKVHSGEDPLEAERQRRAALTWAQWVDGYEDSTVEHSDDCASHSGSECSCERRVPGYLDFVRDRKKRPDEDIRYLSGHSGGRAKDAKPVKSETMKRWGSRKVAEILHNDVQRLLEWHAEHHGRTTANRWYASVRACFQAAVRAGVIKDNPARHVKKYPENAPRQRVLSDAEYKRLREAVLALENAFDRTIMLVLLETGCRLSEALSMRWEDLNLDVGVWTLPSPKSGHPQAIPLAPSTAKAVNELPRVSSTWVFPSLRDPQKHRHDIRTLWAKLRTAAKVEDVNVHDIRRTYGLRVAQHAGVLAASKLLRHSSVAVTSRVYAPLGLDSLREVAEAVTKSADVVPIGEAVADGSSERG